MYTLQSTHTKILMNYDRIVTACQKWKIIEFALFGSVLRDDFQPDRSDVDDYCKVSTRKQKGK